MGSTLSPPRDTRTFVRAAESGAVAPPRPARWRAWLIYIHRWLGTVGGLLFVTWFASGIVMMYARMPAVTVDEHAWHAEPLDVSSLRVTPSEAAATARVPNANGTELGMLRGRPVYRLRGRAARAVFADDGALIERITDSDAVAIAREWAPGSASTAKYGELVTVPDQWTLQQRQHLPLHLVLLGDAADTRLYISSRTGEVVVDATRGERFWGYLGPVMHWLYLPVLRRNGPAWTQVILWTSGIGCVMCIAGLAIGLLQFSPSARYRQRAGGARSPYSGLMKWHHYVGLAFGVVTLLWTFSGLMSMGPFELFSDGPVPPGFRSATTGKDKGAPITAAGVQAAAASIAKEFAPKELSLIRFKGEPFWVADASPAGPVTRSRTTTESAPRMHRLISAAHPERGAFARFDDSTMAAVSKEAMPGVAIAEATWIDRYDDYYIHRLGERPLPVLRVRYADPQQTLAYFDPGRGSAAEVLRPKERLDRWLYQGLHSLSFPALYFRRPLWDVIVVALLLGGIVLGVTTLTPAWRRLGRHARALARGRNESSAV